LAHLNKYFISGTRTRTSARDLTLEALNKIATGAQVNAIIFG
jgi:hypothetical protein